MSKFETDGLDEQIIAQLQADGRISFREISRQIGASESVVRQRVRRMEKHRAIRIGVVVDLAHSQLEIVAWVRISLEPGSLNNAVTQLVALKESTYVATVTGTYNVLVVLCATNVADLVKAVDNHILTINGVQDVDVRIVGETFKHDFREIALN